MSVRTHTTIIERFEYFCDVCGKPSQNINCGICGCDLCDKHTFYYLRGHEYYQEKFCKSCWDAGEKQRKKMAEAQLKIDLLQSEWKKNAESKKEAKNA